MIVCEELQCDWSKVRPQYASANRDAKEMAPDWTLNVPGNGGTDPNGGGEPTFGNRGRTGVPRHPRQRLPPHADQRRVVREGRPLLPAARRRRGARALAARRGERLGRAGGGARREGRRDQSREEQTHDHLRQDRAPRRANAASASRQDQDQAAGSVDADGHRAEEPRRADEGDGRDRLRDRREVAGDEVGGREVVRRVRRRREELRLRRGPEHAGRALGRPVPDPRSRAHARPRVQRRRGGDRRSLVSGEDRARPNADRVGHPGAARRVQHGEHACGARSLRSTSRATYA